jgi:macrocin-O-methyltransferase TylF-like protien
MSRDLGLDVEIGAHALRERSRELLDIAIATHGAEAAAGFLNFRRYGLLDEQVRFLKGWFRDTLPSAPIKTLALLRLDGDLYESTMDALSALYRKVVPGGFVIIDDYGDFEPCRRAIHEFRDKSGIDDPIERIDDSGVYWRKSIRNSLFRRRRTQA